MSRKTLTKLLALASIGLAPSAIAQRALTPITGVDLVRPGNGVTINPDLIRPGIGNINLETYRPELEASKLKPLKENLFKLRDPQTGKAISGAKVLTLPNGKKITAAEYYKELNKQEAYLNKLGKTLRDSKEDLGVVQTVKSTKKLALNQQKLAIESTRPYVKSGLEPQLKVIRDAIKLNPNLVNIIDVIKDSPIIFKPKPIGECESSDTMDIRKLWDKKYGNNWFNVKPRAGYRFYASCNVIEAKAYAKVDGTAFKKGFNIVSSEIKGRAVRNSDYSIKFDLKVVGKEIYSYDRSMANSITWGSRKGSSVSKDMKLRFFIGPIPVNIKIGVRGSAYVNYGVKLDGLSALAEIRPEASASVYAEGGIDLILVGGGVGGQFNLIVVSLPINGKIEITPRSGSLYFHASTYAGVSLKALNGKIYGYVEVVVPRWGIPPWKKKRYSKTFVNWSGIEFERKLFGRDHWQRII
ncbi:MAG: hypothetical protein HRU19_03775 [Pseudobacteriovorax sp.]|nr:hypothetical protein [Pseudobacteriovorax sp.]